MASSAEDLSLAAAFARGLEVFTRMQSGDADAEALASGAAAMRHAVARVDVEGVFSRNETKDDVPTENLRYALAPWYLAELASRAPTRDAAAREHALVEVSAMYEAFLERCERHDMLSESAKRSRARGAEACDPATARDEKVARFKRERAIRQRLESLDAARVERTRKALAEADWDDEDPEASVATENEADERERWLLLVERAAAEALDAAAVVAMEREMLARRAETPTRREAEADADASDDIARRRPYRIEASTGMGNYVIGPGGTIEPISAGGYVPPGRKPGAAPVGAAPTDRRAAAALGVFRPSHTLPTMTVEQHGEIEYRELVERTQREAETKARRAAEDAALTEEERDARELAKARAWDEFKDDNPFGHGNSKLRPCS
jgi:hypothetical protein